MKAATTARTAAKKSISHATNCDRTRLYSFASAGDSRSNCAISRRRSFQRTGCLVRAYSILRSSTCNERAVGFGVRLLESPQALSRLDRSTAEGEYRHNSIEIASLRVVGFPG